MDVDDFDTEENDQDDNKIPISVSFKSFHLLNALSDLLMLPKDLLLEKSIRKEVCIQIRTVIYISRKFDFTIYYIL